MLVEPLQPLQIAARVVAPSTLSAVRRSPFALVGWKILDRWAMNTPDKLRALEAQGEVVLLGRLLDQQNLELDSLLENLSLHAAGVSESEILQFCEIQTELR